jgi:hypothetical protein
MKKILLKMPIEGFLRDDKFSRNPFLFFTSEKSPPCRKKGTESLESIGNNRVILGNT